MLSTFPNATSHARHVIHTGISDKWNVGTLETPSPPGIQKAMLAQCGWLGRSLHTGASLNRRLPANELPTRRLCHCFQPLPSRVLCRAQVAAAPQGRSPLVSSEYCVARTAQSHCFPDQVWRHCPASIQTPCASLPCPAQRRPAPPSVLPFSGTLRSPLLSSPLGPLLSSSSHFLLHAAQCAENFLGPDDSGASL